MHKYKLLGKKGEGTFSEVLKAQDIKSNKMVAIKCMKNHFDSVDQVNRLREIQALRRLSPHPNIIKLHEVLYDRSTGRLALVFELMEMNIYELIRGRRQYLPDDKILHYMYQMMKGIDHMHRNGIFHRDIKPENVLILSDALKLADFGSCRGIYSKQPFTEYISTRWYRAPECLLTDGYYNYKMDIWGVGCVFFEVMALYPLFPGNNELDQIHKVHSILGTPAQELLQKLSRYGTHMDYDFPAKQGTGLVKLLPHASPDAMDLLTKLLTYNPDDRPSARQALRHPYFKEIRELDKKLRKQKGGTAADDDDNDNSIDNSALERESNNSRSQNENAGGGGGKLPPLGGGGGAGGLGGGGGGSGTGSTLPSINKDHSTKLHSGTIHGNGGGGGGANSSTTASMNTSLAPKYTNAGPAKTTSDAAPKGLPKLAPLGRK